MAVVLPLLKGNNGGILSWAVLLTCKVSSYHNLSQRTGHFCTTKKSVIASRSLVFHFAQNLVHHASMQLRLIKGPLYQNVKIIQHSACTLGRVKGIYLFWVANLGTSHIENLATVWWDAFIPFFNTNFDVRCQNDNKLLIFVPNCAIPMIFSA